MGNEITKMIKLRGQCLWLEGGAVGVQFVSMQPKPHGLICSPANLSNGEICCEDSLFNYVQNCMNSILGARMVFAGRGA